ncbi:hypothetical protein [Corynebacterium aquatimens]|uniref:Serine hydrolase n=1 Tax=Corynebacterium aquatimens TaxID=1190508 RepID=A0A931E2Y0_9CORY|nr:hypothetical protein [Corynebacterium aquatimens]MBG6122605.1 hypothetical protein [Corynebacterium aquatimens]
MKLKGIIAALFLVAAVIFVPQAAAMDVRAGAQGGRTAVAVYHPNGSWTGSPDATQPRRALSLSKLYLGYWILQHGSPGEKAQVEHMIRVSSDSIAARLDSAHPQAIDVVARNFGLHATHRNGRWGNTSTSAYDVAKFVNDIRFDPVAQPIINGMRTAAPIAQDGFAQNYGTSRLPGAEGTKFGWSDNRWSNMASVSFGPGWTAAAMTNGNAAANTNDALAMIGPEVHHFAGSSFALPTIRWVPIRELLPPFFPPQLVDLIAPELLWPVLG